jgi:iron complex outermembrane receptor protein
MAILLFLALFVGMGPVQADEAAKRKAKVHFKQGTALFEKGEFKAAALEFAAAYELSPHPQVLYNLASSYYEGKEPDKAIVTYRRYLAETDVDPAELVTLRQRISQLEATVSEVRVGCAVADCVISVNGEERGKAPVTVVLLPGLHAVEAMVNGRVAEVAQVELRAGEDKSLTMALGGVAPKVEAQPEPVPSSEPESDLESAKKKTLRWPFWVASGLAVAAGAATVVFAVKTNKEEQEFQDTGSTDTGLHDKGVRDKLITNILIGVTGAAAATAIGFMLYDLLGDERPKTPKDSARVRVAPGPGLGIAAAVEF